MKYQRSPARFRRVVRGVLVVVAALIVLAGCGGDSLKTANAKVPMPAGTQASFDDVEINQGTHTVYAADQADTGVDVFDVSGPQPAFVKTIQLPAAPKGLAIDPALGRLYAGLNGGSIEVIDTVTDTLSGEIKTGEKGIDLIDFAPGPKYLIASSGGNGSVLTIDTVTGKVISTAKIGAPLEQPRYDPASGNVYVTVPDKAALTVVEPKTGAVKGTVKLGACIPVGLAIKGRTAVIACHSSVIAFDLVSLKQTDLGGLQDGDIVHYYPDVDRFFVTQPHGDLPTLVGMYGGSPLSFIGSVQVDGGGLSAVYDQRNDLVYTTNRRPGAVGLTGFHMDGTLPTNVLQAALFAGGPLLALLLLVMALWLFLGRHADPIHRPQPKPKPERESEPRTEPEARPKLTT